MVRVFRCRIGTMRREMEGDVLSIMPAGNLRMLYVDHVMITRQKFHIDCGGQVCVANSTSFRTLNGHLH
jgi:hypothetical protein